MRKRARSVYIDEELFKRCENFLKEKNPTLLEEYKNSNGYYTKVVRYIVRRCLDKYEKEKK